MTKWMNHPHLRSYGPDRTIHLGREPSRMHRAWRGLCIGSLLLCINACAVDPKSSRNYTLEKARETGFQDHTPRDFPGLVLLKQSQPNLKVAIPTATGSNMTPHLIIFIEGDGAAWRRSGTSPPHDPTPEHLIPLELAILESGQLDLRVRTEERQTFIAYLSRPCQFRWASECNAALWTSARFGSQVQALMNSAVSALVQTTLGRSGIQSGSQPHLSLIGYSGGGAIAALLAASRDDVSCLITLAAPLDIRAWERDRGLSPLSGSQNPVDLLDRLAALRSHHFVGENDSVVRPAALGEFVNPANSRQVHLVPETSHTSGWTNSWKHLRQLTCLKENS